ncbi:LuxR C-terminal-related transcriptional regulator [Nocardia rhizosphaerae]|uniref:LuxR C-terminal-related transcriptional regulator n=1 Tax=Nocardia rhizosphaerae TaxID=1691571 RepID=A0ABV8LCR0_9NOCA
MTDTLLDQPIRPALSPREREVLVGWILSDTKSDACAKLHIATGTMNTHLERIREKYERAGRPAHTKAALLARALQDGYLRLSDL